MRRARDDEAQDERLDMGSFVCASKLIKKASATPSSVDQLSAAVASSTYPTKASSCSPSPLLTPTSAEATPTCETHSTASPQRVVIKSGPRGADEVIVVNSPYAAQRAQYGWGSLFSPPRRAAVPGYDNIHIGISSLNAVPTSKMGSSRPMRDLMEQYRRKFDCLEHCYTYHNVGDADMWRSWSAMAQNINKTRNQCIRTQNSNNNTNYDNQTDESVFVYTIKANKLLTHVKQLVMDAEAEAHIELFFDVHCAELETHLGPVLLQLPPFFQRSETNMNRLRTLHRKLEEIHARYVRRFHGRDVRAEQRSNSVTDAVPASRDTNATDTRHSNVSHALPHVQPPSLSDTHAHQLNSTASPVPARAIPVRSPIRIAVEFRHYSWYHADVFHLLRELGWSLVAAHHANETTFATPVDTGSGFLYLRLHGSLGENVGDYGPARMNRCAVMIQEYLIGTAACRNKSDTNTDSRRGSATEDLLAEANSCVDSSREVFVLFNNTTSHIAGTTSSVVDATYLAERLTEILPPRSMDRSPSTTCSRNGSHTGSPTVSTASAKREACTQDDELDRAQRAAQAEGGRADAPSVVSDVDLVKIVAATTGGTGRASSIHSHHAVTDTPRLGQNKTPDRNDHDVVVID